MVTEPDQVERANAAKRNQRCLSNQMTAPLHACDAWQIEAQQKRKRRRYGNIYEMSFEYERLKKIKISAIQMTSSKAGLKPLGWRGISSARRMLRHKIETHGRKPAMMTGTK